jgi:hypothetical protein
VQGFARYPRTFHHVDSFVLHTSGKSQKTVLVTEHGLLGYLWCECVDLPSQGSGPSSIGATVFHDPVRDGTGWFHCANHTLTGRGTTLPSQLKYV